jgi:hypothetical protein
MFIFDRPFTAVAAGLGMALLFVWLGRLTEPPVPEELAMTIRIGTKAPDFEAESTHWHDNFRQWICTSWCVVLSSRPHDCPAASASPAIACERPFLNGVFKRTPCSEGTRDRTSQTRTCR